MESIIFSGSVVGMLWLGYIVYKSEKNEDGKKNHDLGVFAFKKMKETLRKASLKK